MSEHTHVEVSSSQFLVFTSEANGTIEVRYEDGTIWLTQKLMAELFDVDVRTISEHLRNIYDSGELMAEATIRNFRIVRTEGSRQVTRGIDHYNLDARELLPTPEVSQRNLPTSMHFENTNPSVRFKTVRSSRTLIASPKRRIDRSNLVKGRTFSEMLGDALSRYTNRALTTVEISTELVNLAKKKYPPDKREQAVQLVIEQAEHLATEDRGYLREFPCIDSGGNAPGTP